jgi:hypothetical protein
MCRKELDWSRARGIRSSLGVLPRIAIVNLNTTFQGEPSDCPDPGRWQRLRTRALFVLVV